MATYLTAASLYATFSLSSQESFLIKTPEFLGVISTGANSKNKPITTTNRSIILRKLFKNISGPNPISLKTIYITITTIITSSITSNTLLSTYIVKIQLTNESMIKITATI